MTKQLIHVAAGALERSDGKILISRRADDVHQGGLWEFPGGKLEPGENVADALCRELFEELGIQVRRSEPLIRVRHDYGDRQVLLDVHKVDLYVGEPLGREGQPLRWLQPAAMQADEFPAADRPIINALRLPERMLITGADARYPALFIDRLQRALEHGLRLVQMRAPELDSKAYFDLAAAVGMLCGEHGASLILNPPRGPLDFLPEPAGLHLNRWRLMGMKTRPLGYDRLIGASCHSMEELLHAQRLELDYALLSPVKPTSSHPESPVLGWKRFAEWVDRAAIPVYALGGMDESDMPSAKQAGAQGIAAIGAWWPTVDSE